MNKNVKVGTAQLTPEGVKVLTALQADDNRMLNCHTEAIGDAVCFLSLIQEYLSEPMQLQARLHIYNLAHIKMDIDTLKK